MGQSPRAKPGEKDSKEPEQPDSSLVKDKASVRADGPVATNGRNTGQEGLKPWGHPV